MKKETDFKLIKVDKETHLLIKTFATMAGLSMKQLIKDLFKELDGSINKKDQSALFDLMIHNRF